MNKIFNASKKKDDKRPCLGGERYLDLIVLLNVVDDDVKVWTRLQRRKGPMGGKGRCEGKRRIVSQEEEEGRLE